VLSLLFSSPFAGGCDCGCTCTVGAAKFVFLASLGNLGTGLGFGLTLGLALDDVALGAIFRMKFMGALGLASARAKRPLAAEGGNGTCGVGALGR